MQYDEDTADSVIRQMWSRIPWLLIGILGGILNSKLLFEKIHIDPAIATGPFVQITNDLLGMGIYMLVITLII